VDDLRALHQNITLAKINPAKATPEIESDLVEDFKEVEIGDGDQHMEPMIVSRPKQ
jgi:hypothetical protein